jgi:hypothetical protein
MTEARRRRPRPVADAPVGLLADGRGVAKAWLLALVDGAALESVSEIPVADLAGEGPALCAALLAAMGSDEALDALPARAARVGAIAGARDAAAVVAAAEALRGAASDALRAQLIAAPAALEADLADRLAHVCSVVAAAGLASHAPGPRAVLAVEIDDLERLLAAGSERDLEAADAAVADAVAPPASLTLERSGRYWIECAAGDAPGLAARVAAVVAGAAAPAGVALTASVGTAVAPHDGTDLEEVRAEARRRLFAARAGGLRLS